MNIFQDLFLFLGRPKNHTALGSVNVDSVSLQSFDLWLTNLLQYVLCATKCYHNAVPNCWLQTFLDKLWQFWHELVLKFLNIRILSSLVANLRSFLALLLEQIVICVYWVFCRKFNSQQFLFGKFFEILGIFCCVCPLKPCPHKRIKHVSEHVMQCVM